MAFSPGGNAHTWSSVVNGRVNAIPPNTLSGESAAGNRALHLDLSRWRTENLAVSEVCSSSRVTRVVNGAVRSPGFHQIPQVAIEVLEDSDGTESLFYRFPNENDAFRPVKTNITPTVIAIKKEKDAATGLIR
jgi:hypothetical protein